ncbi:MAG: hypothetical protein WAZ34_14230 [Rhodocyclaceae bacterium]
MIAGAALLLLLLAAFGASGVAAWGKNTSEMADTAEAPDVQPIASESEARSRTRCSACGVVESARRIGQQNRPAHDGPSGNAARYEITIRMRDGTSRVFIDTNPTNWQVGERVSLIGGASQASN